ARIIDQLAARPKTGRGAILSVALLSMLVCLLHWGLSLILGSLYVRALARREELRMDYRAAAAAAYLGLGSVWAMGLSSSAAQLQANPGSMPPGLLEITGVIPFTDTIFLWQSITLTAILIGVTLWVVWVTVPSADRARTAHAPGTPAEKHVLSNSEPTRPGEWLEHSPILNVAIALLSTVWLAQEFITQGAAAAISNLNTYNLLFLTLGLLLCWRPRTFLDAVSRAVPSATGVLIQFPLYGGIASLITAAPGSDGHTIAHHLSAFFAEA